MGSVDREQRSATDSVSLIHPRHYCTSQNGNSTTGAASSITKVYGAFWHGGNPGIAAIGNGTVTVSANHCPGSPTNKPGNITIHSINCIAMGLV